MNPLRWDVLLAGFVLSLPVLALGIRGDLTIDEVTTRLLWCLAAGWVAVALLRVATTPQSGPQPRRVAAPVESLTHDSEPAPAP